MNINKFLSFFIVLILTQLLFNCIEPEKKESSIDYCIEDAEFPTSLEVDTGDIVRFTIKNKGEQDSINSVIIKLYISQNYYYEEDNGIYLNEISTTTGLISEQSWSNELSFTLPPESPASGYFILKIESTEEESNKFNNVAASSKISVIGGFITRTEILADSQFYEFEINEFETKYYFFNAVQGHAYEIFWDDYYEGLNNFESGADILITSRSEDLSQIYFTEIDSGYYEPSKVSVSNSEMVLLDVKSQALSGNFSIKIKDAGIPPDLSISLDSSKYSNSNNTLELLFTVYNKSTVSTNSACFYIGFWLDRASEPSKDEVADYYSNLCPSISPGSIYSTTAFVPTSLKNGVAYAIVDVYDNMVEGDEFNNISAAHNW